MVILGIESSCDDTAAAVVADGTRVLSSVVSSQFELHAPYGGVVPELASRSHITTVFQVVDDALIQSGVPLEALDAIAVTAGPGLVGSLLVGLQAAKTLSFATGIPLVGVNHLEGHLYAIFLSDDPPAFPFVLLLASGGHTSLFHAREPGRYELLGETRDDASGEAFDKAAKMLGLGYPGGVAIDRLAKGGDPTAVKFPRALPRRDSLEFSFSGLKTAIRQHIARHPPQSDQELSDLCASIQEAIVEVMIRKARRALRRKGISRLVLAGGVAANSRLREAAAEAAAEDRFRLHLPPRSLCTDNAAMIAAAGHARFLRGERATYTLNADANLPLTRGRS